jgi:8-oxo-dGTP pyrophosphatase MutT (NUDIX family)
MELRDYISNELARLNPGRLTSGFDGEAAVLMPIFEQEGQPFFLLTLRTEQVRTHKGQISFPGGMRHGGESLEQTALRETHEEVGIPKNSIEILGRFHDYLSVTGCLVAPFAGFIRGTFATVPQTAEVAQVLKVPFAVFADPGRLRVESMERMGRKMDVYFYRYDPIEIWGLTARIIRDFFDALRLPPLK